MKCTFRCQFHQRFTCSFYTRRSQKRKRIQLSHQYLFTLLGSASVKVVRRTLMKLSPGHFSLLLETFSSVVGQTLLLASLKMISELLNQRKKTLKLEQLLGLSKSKVGLQSSGLNKVVH